jgi:hypothetical protein
MILWQYVFMIFYVFELCYMLIMVLMSYRQLFFYIKEKKAPAFCSIR